MKGLGLPPKAGHLRMSTTCCRLLVSTLLLTVITGCMGPVFRHTRAYDVPADSVLWGEFGPGKVIRLRQDLLISGGGGDYGGTLTPGGKVEIAEGVYEQLSMETYKKNPSQWPQYDLVVQGTTLRCLKLGVFRRATVTTTYHLTAEILDGEHRGRKADLLFLLHMSNDDQGRSILVANPRFLEVLTP
jgi:hypothetical protein